MLSTIFKLPLKTAFILKVSMFFIIIIIIIIITAFFSLFDQISWSVNVLHPRLGQKFCYLIHYIPSTAFILFYGYYFVCFCSWFVWCCSCNLRLCWLMLHLWWVLFCSGFMCCRGEESFSYFLYGYLINHRSVTQQAKWFYNVFFFHWYLFIGHLYFFKAIAFFLEGKQDSR